MARANLHQQSVGISNSHRGKSANLHALHSMGGPCFFMIMAKEVKHAVDNEVGDMIGEALALELSFAPDDAGCKYDVAEESAVRRFRRWEGKNIGGPALGTPSTIEPRAQSVCRKSDRNLAVRWFDTRSLQSGAGGGFRKPAETTRSLPGPKINRNQNRHHGVAVLLRR
jgi:hypothetical protein